MVVFFTRETAQRVHNDSVNPPSVLAAVRKKLFEFRSISRLRRLAPLNKNSVHIVAVAMAVFDTSLLLGGQAQVVDLVFGADPAIDDSSHCVSR
jgi:hypothetical protein